MTPRLERVLKDCWIRMGAKAWEPQSANSPLITDLLATGYLERCDMRCGAEAFKETGLRWTDAGKAAMLAKYGEVK